MRSLRPPNTYGLLGGHFFRVIGGQVSPTSQEGDSMRHVGGCLLFAILHSGKGISISVSVPLPPLTEPLRLVPCLAPSNLPKLGQGLVVIPSS